MIVELQPDDIDFATGEFPRLCTRTVANGPVSSSEYGVTFGARDQHVTLWFRSEGERPMMLQTAELLVQR